MEEYGYNADRTEYYSPFAVTIYHEDRDFYHVIASTAHRAQSICLPASPLENIGYLANKVEYFTPLALVLSTRVPVEQYTAIFERGFSRIVTIDKTISLTNVIIADIEEVASYVKLVGNGYFLFNKYLALEKKTDGFARVATELKYFKRGLTLTSDLFPEKVKEYCDKLSFITMYDNIVARGCAYYDLHKYRADLQIASAREITVRLDNESDIKCAVVCVNDYTFDIVAEITPLSPLTKYKCVIYAFYQFTSNNWYITAISREPSFSINNAVDNAESDNNTCSAISVLKVFSEGAKGSEIRASCVVSDLNSLFR
jgi:hypothetical protein